MTAALIWPVAAAIGLFFGSVSWLLREHSRHTDALATLPAPPVPPVPPSPDEVARLMEPLVADLADQLAVTIMAMPYVICDHNDRPSCPKCATRLTVRAAAALVREMGGVQR